MLSFKNILAPIDFGPSSEEALRAATDLAKMFDAELTVLHVWEVPDYAYTGMDFSTLDVLAPARDLAESHLDGRIAALRKEGANVRGILGSGSPWLQLQAAMEELAPDLVVMGTHGRHGLARALLGSIAEKTVRSAPCPVLTFREKSSTTRSHRALP